MKQKNLFRCPSCDTINWYVDKETLKRGDKPTEVECVECGYRTVV